MACWTSNPWPAGHLTHGLTHGLLDICCQAAVTRVVALDNGEVQACSYRRMGLGAWGWEHGAGSMGLGA